MKLAGGFTKLQLADDEMAVIERPNALKLFPTLVRLTCCRTAERSAARGLLAQDC